jgi:glycosyltransferase involved in cell wall biosynthesis
MEKWSYERGFTQQNRPIKKILIEVSKLFTNDHDGINRYLAELIQHLPVIIKNRPDWQIHTYFNNSIQTLDYLYQELGHLRASKFHRQNPVGKFKSDLSKMDYENKLLFWKANIKENIPDSLYDFLGYIYRKGPFRWALKKYRKFKRSKTIRTQEKQKQYQHQSNVYDLIHTPLPQNLEFVKHIKGQHLVTVHDMTHKYFPQLHRKDNVAIAESGMKWAQKLNAHILAISKATKNDVQNAYRFEKDKIHLVYEAVNQSRFRQQRSEGSLTKVCKKYNFPNSPYFLCLSTIEPRKNLTNTAHAFIQLVKEHSGLNISLVICGKKGWKAEDIFKKRITHHPNIYFTGFIDDEDLPILYAHAKALCYISYYEGFGLPILEAMSCGTPVIYGNNSSMPEIASPGGLPADATNIEDIKHQMKRILMEEGLRDQLSKAAWRQAQKFSWLKVAIETLEVYENIIAKKK